MSYIVLVVDDNPEIADLFATVIEIDGMVALTAHNLAEACRACEHMKVDAVVMDLSLPDGKGSDFLKRLDTKYHPRVKLLLTGHCLANIEEKFPGFDGYYNKPIDCGYLCTIIRERMSK